MSIRDIKVIAVRGERDGQSGAVSVWPIFHLQDWVNVAWGDGTISTAHRGDIIAPDEAAQLERHAAVETRLRELSRMPKRDLLTIVLQLARQRGASWAIGGPHLWSKEELLDGALRFQFGEFSEASSAQHCHWCQDPDCPGCGRGECCAANEAACGTPAAHAVPCAKGQNPQDPDWLPESGS